VYNEEIGMSASSAAVRTSLVGSLLGCVLLMLFVPAGAGSVRAPAAARGVPLTPVTIAALPLEPTAQIFYAKHRGFFARQGIDARITLVTDPPQIVAAVLSGDAQFSPVNSGALAILKTRGAPIRVVAAGALYRRKAPASALVAAPRERITRARDLVGKRIGIDARNTIAHIGLLKWLKGNGVSADDVRLVEIPFAQMLAPLRRGTIDAAFLPEPYLTMATQRGARRVAHAFHAVCARDCLLTFFMARRDVDPNLAARFRNAVQAAAVWANKTQNDRASGAILARYAPIDAAVIRKMTRTRFSERLRPAPAQPWIDVYAEFGVIPASFSALDLVK
jgi:NitT/TauT family transport system substrate-binding protein